MSGLLPLEINPYVLAAQSKNLEGYVLLSSMNRLAPMLQSIKGHAFTGLRFSTLESGVVVVKGFIRATLLLQCQRCLSQYENAIDNEMNIALVTDDDQAARLECSIETFSLNVESLSLSQFLEEELLLSLPVVPMHPDINDCAMEMTSWLRAEDSRSNQNPFKVLEKLKAK